MKSLTFLGIASNSFSSLSTCSFVIELENNNLLLTDCGPDIPRQIYKNGKKFYDIKTVILTHSHLDHVLGLPYLLFGRNLEVMMKNKQGEVILDDEKQLTIISERSLFDKIVDFFSFCHPEVKLQYNLKHIEIADFTTSNLKLLDAELQFFKVDHAVPTHGFKIKTTETSIAYSSDTLPSEAFANGCINVDILIYECMMPSTEKIVSRNTKHSTPIDAIEMVKKIYPRRGYLMHIQPICISQKSNFEQEIFEGTGIEMKYPNEGETIFF